MKFDRGSAIIIGISWIFVSFFIDQETFLWYATQSLYTITIGLLFLGLGICIKND